MSLLARVVQFLESHDVASALIGASAMAAHGVSRSTADIDLLTTDHRVLTPAFWILPDPVDIRRGDGDDPLAGVVRIADAAHHHVDIVVGNRTWQRELVEQAEPRQFQAVPLRVVSAKGLILLKLYAGGPQDCWDIQQLLAANPEPLTRGVDAVLPALPRRCAELWDRITKG